MRFMVWAIALRSLLFFLGMEADPTPAVGEPLGLAASPPSVGVLFRQLSAAAGGAAVDRRCMALRSLAMGDAPGASSALLAGANFDARDAGRPTFAGPVAAFTEAAPLSMTHTCRWHYCQKCSNCHMVGARNCKTVTPNLIDWLAAQHASLLCCSCCCQHSRAVTTLNPPCLHGPHSTVDGGSQSVRRRDGLAHAKPVAKRIALHFQHAATAATASGARA